MSTTTRPGGTARLGEHEVARIGYGALQIGEHAGEESKALNVLRRARDLGVDHLDTAHFYGDDLANRLVREALAPYDGMVLATKVGAVRAGGTLVPAQQPAELRAQVEQNLATLGVERVDVVNLRRVDARPGLVAEGDQVVDLDDQLAELSALRDEGKLGAIGLSAVTADQLRQALPAGIACVQNAGSLLDRSGEAVHAVAREHDLAWVPFFPLGSGFPGQPKVGEHLEVVAQAQRLGCTPAQLGLAWLLVDDAHTLLIPGTASIEHLEDNAAAGAVVLDDEAIRSLEDL